MLQAPQTDSLPDDLNTTLIGQHREFLIEELDYARVYLDWAQRHLAEGRYEKSIAAFELYIAKTRDATVHMKAVRAFVLGDPVAKAAIVEFREERNKRR